MSANNSIKIVARVPQAGSKFLFNYTKNEAEPSKDYIMFKGSVKRNYKPAGEQYYPEDVFTIKAFGQKARYMGEICGQGTIISVEGTMQRDDDWTDKDGNVHTNNWVLYATDISFICNIDGSTKKSNNSASATAPAATPANSRPAVSGSPFANMANMPRK